MKYLPLDIRMTIDVKTEHSSHGVAGELLVIYTDPIPEPFGPLTVSLSIRESVKSLPRYRFTLKPEDVKPSGLILVRLPEGLPLSLAELRVVNNRTRGSAYLLRIHPDGKERPWRNPFLKFC